MNHSTTRWIPRDGVKPVRIAIINRGEAAVRFMRTARVWSRRNAQPVELIAFYTDPDARAPFVQMADTAVSLGDPFMIDASGARVSSYLDVEGLVAKCTELGVDAVWPGWGFLGESADLSDACKDAGIKFIGPPGGVMRLLGDKIRSKAFAEEHNVPVSPWSGRAIEDPEEAKVMAEKIGFPLILKAAAGGGGRGIRLVQGYDELADAFHTATTEAISAFGDGALFMEKYVEKARHVEVQVLADSHGTVWALGTRDCSVQRRHQKIIEETPAPGLAPEVYENICESAR
ncbi:MAG: biotin carboxylase N-terminal domain-containing protein, partial [Myxococcota bacterium]|nr:biotin carboxylase N-terminal domain-containing protein [Myxococcota bacterium]